jgi:hypothetical protein
MRHFLASSILAGLAAFSHPSFAQEKAQEKAKPELLPPPTPVQEFVMPYYLPSSLPQPGTREVWQFYGVDQRGQWRPRVILSPLGAYYLYNGQPFYFTTTRPDIYMPYVLD